MKNYRLGIIARSDKTGLGYQTRSYVKQLEPAKVIEIDISSLNGNEQQLWYAPDLTIRGIPTDIDIEKILDGIDVLLTAETPYNLKLYGAARKRGIKTICVENPEFYDHEIYYQYELPDLIILPSVWKADEIKAHAEPRGGKVVQIHHPVDLDEITYTNRTSLKRFLHIAGKPAANDRNGTFQYLSVCPNGVVATQSNDLAHLIGKRYPHCIIKLNTQNNNELYSLGDVLVLPRRYGGNCLVLNEALASGMPVIMPDISPNNHILPKEWLVPAYVDGYFTPRTKVDLYTCHPQALYAKLDWFKEQDLSALSKQAFEIAQSISWEILKPKYIEAIESIL